MIDTSTCLERSTPSILDCDDGLQCGDYECEKRHLDTIESSNVLQIPTKRNVIITASRDMGRSASTWVFNAIRLLYRKANIACDSYWIRDLSAEKIKFRLEHGQSHVLIKTHEQYVSRNVFEHQIRPLCSHIVVSLREGFTPDKLWIQHATHVTKFENIVEKDRVIQVLRDLANHLNISGLSDSDLRCVDFELMTLPIPGDQSSKFWSFHKRRGGRLAPQQS